MKHKKKCIPHIYCPYVCILYIYFVKIFETNSINSSTNICVRHRRQKAEKERREEEKSSSLTPFHRMLADRARRLQQVSTIYYSFHHRMLEDRIERLQQIINLSLLFTRG
jgi:hypothetical protein